MTKSILIVEDDPAIRETFKFALEFEGYETYTAANGKEGIDVLHRMPKPCVILLDLMMPVMNGWEFVEEVEKEEILPAIPLVVVTAFGRKAENIKANSVIRKPVSLDDLLNVVKQWCGNAA